METLSRKEQIEKASQQPSLLSYMTSHDSETYVKNKENKKDWLKRAESGEIMRII